MLKLMLEIKGNNLSQCVARQVRISGVMPVNVPMEDAIEQFREAWERVVAPVQVGMGFTRSEEEDTLGFLDELDAEEAVF